MSSNPSLAVELDQISSLVSAMRLQLAPLSDHNALAVVGLIADFTIARLPEAHQRDAARTMAESLIDNAQARLQPPNA